VRLGLVTRTPRGRIATPQAWRHFGMTPGQSGAGPALFGDDD
ncbi:MAG: Holliday junction branch migration DNA helicase RuvB, partial [Curtobacterium sp.]